MSEAWAGGSDSRWRRFRLTILERDRWTCAIGIPGTCTSTATHVDHIQPLSKGGSKFDPANCRASCRACNLKRGDSGTVEQPEPRPVSSW